MTQAHDERNYHIFYCMLAGMTNEEKQKLDVSDATKYWYLTQVNSLLCQKMRQIELSKMDGFQFLFFLSTYVIEK